MSLYVHLYVCLDLQIEMSNTMKSCMYLYMHVCMFMPMYLDVYLPDSGRIRLSVVDFTRPGRTKCMSIAPRSKFQANSQLASTGRCDGD